MTVDELLDALVLDEGWTPSWEDVLERAAYRPRRHRRRTLALALLLLTAVLIPLIAVAASNDFWFIRYTDRHTRPTTSPVVVEAGDFGGRRWQLIAYPASDGLCWGLILDGGAGTGRGSAFGCGSVVGFPDKPGSTGMTISYVYGTSSDAPAWIAGPVSPEATTVVIHFANGTVRTQAFGAPKVLKGIRFFVAQVPKRLFPRLHPSGKTAPLEPIRWLAGYGTRGQIVACFNPATATNGISPTRACR